MTINIREKNLMSRQQHHNCLNENEICIIVKLFLALTARKTCVCSSKKKKKKTFGITIFWVDGKNYREKGKMHHISQIKIG